MSRCDALHPRGIPTYFKPEVMVITTTRDASVSDLMELMTRHRIRHLPVVEAGALVGIVSIGDVVKRKIEETEFEATALREYIAS